jgi:hypothetical protein
MSNRPDANSRTKDFVVATLATIVGGVVVGLILYSTLSGDSSSSSRVDNLNSSTATSRLSSSPVESNEELPTFATSPTTIVSTATGSRSLPYSPKIEPRLSDWELAIGWAVADGVLVDSPAKANAQFRILAKDHLDGSPDYAVDAEIQAVESYCPKFGVVVRSGFVVGISSDCRNYAAIGTYGKSGNVFVPSYDGFGVAKVEFVPGNEWHEYRVEIRGNQLTLLIDSVLILQASSNTFLAGGQVGLYAETQIGVRSFRVSALP